MHQREARQTSVNVLAKTAVFFGLTLMTATSLAATAEFIKGQYVIRVKDPQLIEQPSLLAHSLSGAVIDKVRDDMVLIQRTKTESVEDALKALRENPNVDLAEPNYIYKASRSPNDANYKKLWGMKNGGDLDSDGLRGLRGVDINAERAWDITTGSKKVVVAIIDTGVDFNIPDLVDNAWTNQAELNGRPGVDDDGNGYIDDIHGFNFVNNTGDPKDDNGHGSHVAGTIGARGDDGKGVAGVAWNVSIMALKFLDSQGSGSLANAVKAIDYARKNGAKVLSNSWGGGGFAQALKDAIEETRKADELFVAAAGNDGSNNDTKPTYPASYPIDNIVAVAAVDNRGDLADFSNYGATTVHIAAPGVNILSTVPTGFDTYSGTSMATPHVSGVAALVYALNPNLTYTEAKKRLIDSARPLNSLKGKVASGGMLDAYYALTGQTPPADPNDVSIWSGRKPYSVSTPHPYPQKFTETYTITMPGVNRISAHFSKFATEAGYDRVMFYNKANELIGVWSGKQDGRFAPIADGDTLTMKITADDSVNDYGFDIDEVLFEQ
jgi:subtilisin family serine protease